MTEEIRIGYLSTLYHTSLILKGSDLAGELGVGISWRLFPTGPDMIDAFGRGELDLGYIGLPQPSSGSGGA
jgi:NitT/TauT family transport system substrate-binding protein